MSDTPAIPVGPVARWRRILPSAVTALSLVFGMLALQSAVRARPVAGAWWGLYCTLTDKLDGALARALGTASTFGAQLDSLADLTAFGMVPPAVMYAFFFAHPELGWAHGAHAVVLTSLCCGWLIAAAVRLARFNVAASAGSAGSAGSGGAAADFTGTPSTMTAGIVLAAFLALLKYADPRWVTPEQLDSIRLLNNLHTDAALPALPALLALGAVGMVCGLRVPRLGRTSHLLTDVLLALAVALGYGLGLFHLLPEYLAGAGVVYLILTVAHHLRTGHRAGV